MEIFTGLNPGIKPCIAKLKKWSFYVDGDNIPRYFDTNGGYIWRHEDPTTVITTDEAQAGSMSGVVNYFYTEANITTGDGDIHSCHETNPSPIKTTGTLSSKKVVLTLPGSAVNGGMTHLKIYATSPDGTVYYYIGNVEIGTTTFDDDGLTRDANLPFGKLTDTTQTFLNYPVSNHKFVIATKNRLIVFGTRPKTDGSIAVTNGSTTVTGTSTAWTTALENSVLYVDGSSRGYVVESVDSATQITLAEEYAGTTGSALEYEIKGDDSLLRWSSKNPNSAAPMPWSFPVDFYRRIRGEDDSEFMGGGVIGNDPVIFKKYSHYLLNENEDDFIPQKSNTDVGTCSHWSIVNRPTNDDLVFMTIDARLYNSNGVSAVDLGVDLTKTVDGVNMDRLESMEAVWYESAKQYLLSYSSSGSTENDKILVYDFRLSQWWIYSIRCTTLALVNTTNDAGETESIPVIGTEEGFIFQLYSGFNLGSDFGTVSGTITTIDTDNFYDSSASFDIVHDGLKGVYVSLFDTDGEFQEEKLISSNSQTQITVESAFSSSPQVGWTYEIGSIRWRWKSKVFDSDSYDSKTLQKVLLKFKKLSSSYPVSVKIWVSEDSEMPDEEDQTASFDLQYDYVDPEGLYDNRACYYQFEISGHSASLEATINAIQIEYFGRAR